MHYLLLALLAACGLPAGAQSEIAFTLEDADYRVAYRRDSLEVSWRGAPAGDQLERFGARRALLRDERGRPRLLLYPGSPFRYYDRAYADTAWFDYALAAMLEGRDGEDAPTPQTDRAPAAEQTLPTTTTTTTTTTLDKPVEVRFANGLVVRVEQGRASAKQAGRDLPVTGGDGRYRVTTADYEAGVAVMSDGRVWRYLREADPR